jgi:hypothetical protein
MPSEGWWNGTNHSFVKDMLMIKGLATLRLEMQG